MLLDFENLVREHHLDITGVLHIGAHLGEETKIYQQLGIKNVIWVEANPALIDYIETAVPDNNVIIHACMSDVANLRMMLNISNHDGLSSSLYEWGTHKDFAPDFVVVDRIEVATSTVDQMYRTYSLPECNLLNIDVEGATLDVLRGALNNLYRFDYLYLEVQTDNVWDGAPKLGEIEEFLDGFDLVTLGLVADQGWGDSLWVRQPDAE